MHRWTAGVALVPTLEKRARTRVGLEHAFCRYLNETLTLVSDYLGMGLVLNDAAAAAAFFKKHLHCDKVRLVTNGRRAGAPIRLALDDPRHPCRDGGPAGGPFADPDEWHRDRAAAKHRLHSAEKSHH